MHDLRLALRQLARQPVFTVIATLTLAIGIGATTTISGVADALLLQAPKGIREPDEAVEIGRTSVRGEFDTFSYPELRDMQELGGPLETVAGWRQSSLSMSTPEGGERVEAWLVSHTYFDAMGVRPARGRFFTADEDRPGAGEAVAVVSHRFWRSELGEDPDAIGSTIVLNRRPFTVIGIAPAEFVGQYPFVAPDLYVPLAMMPVAQRGFDEFEQRRASWLLAVGRLAPGATHAQANAALRGLFQRLAEPFPEVYAEGRRFARVSPVGLVPTSARGPVGAFIGVLGALVVLVLAITCANVAGMLLARAVGREREIAIRLALGSGRGRIVRHVLAEALVLFALGGALGIALAYWASGLFAAIRLPVPVEVDIDVRPDALVLALGLGIALVTGLVSGLAPALHASRAPVGETLKHATGRIAGRGGRMRRVFVTAQVALSLALLVSAGLFLRSLQRAAAIPTGFDDEGVRLISFDLSIDGYQEAEGIAFTRRVLDRVRALPGVSAAGLTMDLPLDGSRFESPVYPETWADRAEDAGLQSDVNVVSDGYFAATRIALLRGRVFEATDRETSEPVAIVSRTLAEQAWPGEDPIGKRLRFSDQTSELRTVVGVVDVTKNQTLSETTAPMIYLPLSQRYRAALYLVARSSAPPADVAAQLRATLLELDPSLSMTPVQSLEEFTRLGALPQRIAAVVTGILGVLALLLCGLGLYGVVAYHVAQRTREIGVRMALGARARDVRRMVVVRSLALALPGALVGLLIAAAVGRLAQGFLLGVAPLDAAAWLLATCALLAIVAIAALVPAARAAAVEPMRALRAE